MSQEPQKETQIGLVRVIADPMQPPKAAQHFQLTRVDQDFQLDVGHFDLRDFKENIDKVKRGEESDLLFVVTDRFFLSKKGFEVLCRIAREMEDVLAETGKESQSERK